MPQGYNPNTGQWTNTTPGSGDWIKKQLVSRYENERYDGFLPDREVYDQYVDTSVEEIMAGLPVAEEQYEADLASRGIRSSGEATKYKYQQVYAPVAREAAAVATRANLAYAQAYQQGSIAAEETKYKNLQALMNFYFQREMLKFQEAQLRSGNTSSLIEGGIDLVTSIIPFL